MSEPRNRVVQVRRFGGADELEVVDAPMPTAGRGEVRVRVLASGVEYTDVVIRRHLYPQTMCRRPPFVLGYDVIGEIDQLGDGVQQFPARRPRGRSDSARLERHLSHAPASDLTRVPTGVDAVEAAALILSWTTAHQLLHRAARVQRGQRVLVHGAAGAVGQALLVLGKLAGLELWGTARGDARGAGPRSRRDADRLSTGRLHARSAGWVRRRLRRHRGGAAIVGRSRRSSAAACYAPTAIRRACRRSIDLLAILMRLMRVYLLRRLLSWLPGGKRARMYSINLMRARHPAWFREDLERLFGLLATHAVKPHVAERISFDEVAEAHRRLEAGGLEGKLVLCPDLPPRCDRTPPQCEPRPASVQAPPAALN